MFVLIESEYQHQYSKLLLLLIYILVKTTEGTSNRLMESKLPPTSNLSLNLE